MPRLILATAVVGSTFALSSALAAGLTLTATGNAVPVSGTVSTSYCAAAFNVNYDTTTGYISSVTVSSVAASCNGDMYSIAFSGLPTPSLNEGSSDPAIGTLAASSTIGHVTNGFKVVFASPVSVSSLGNVSVTIAP
ncbi:MAG: hypothetical protein WCJ42_02605 [Actinomycetes bacterium]